MSTRERIESYRWLIEGIQRELPGATVSLVVGDYGNRLDLLVEYEGRNYGRPVDGEVGYRDPGTGEEWWKGYNLNGGHFEEAEAVRERVIRIAVDSVKG